MTTCRTLFLEKNTVPIGNIQVRQVDHFQGKNCDIFTVLVYNVYLVGTRYTIRYMMYS